MQKNVYQRKRQTTYCLVYDYCFEFSFNNSNFSFAAENLNIYEFLTTISTVK